MAHAARGVGREGSEHGDHRMRFNKTKEDVMKRIRLFLVTSILVAMVLLGCKDSGTEIEYGDMWIGQANGFLVQLNLVPGFEGYFGTGKVIIRGGGPQGTDFIRNVQSIYTTHLDDRKIALHLEFEIPSRGESIIGKFLTQTKFLGQYSYDDGTGVPIVLIRQRK